MSTTPGKPIYRRPPRQNVSLQMAIKSLFGVAGYLADTIKTHEQAFSELGVYELVRDASMQLANAVARVEAEAKK
jgi:hypothetical protein